MNATFSIDQNCHSLWDVLPKLQALVAAGRTVRHFLEDIDVAFTALGSGVEGGGLRLTRERFHHSGGADWGAALFYSEFLGRLPVDIRRWEPYTGLKTAVLARQLGRSVDELFEEFSPSDNWQLVGPSYVGDRHHHRVIRDLSVAEAEPFLRELLDKAEANMLETFPEQGPRERVREWFRRERALLERLLGEYAGAGLVDLYAAWMRHYLDRSVRLDVTSNFFAVGAGGARMRLLEVFLSRYDLASGLYNEALAETSSELRPLRRKEGELPFFAVLKRQGRWVRTAVYVADGRLRVGEDVFPLAGDGRLPADALASAGVRCLAGKAILLTIQARVGDSAGPLALPYQGSLYMPTSHRLAEKLRAHGLLPGPLEPVLRVRFRLLERMSTLQTRVRLPAHLVGYFGAEEVPASEIARNHAALAAEAAARLKTLLDGEGRKQWQRRSFPELVASIAEVNERRRQLARANPDPQTIRGLWQRAKALQVELLDRTLRQIAGDYQLSRIDYWDSRGALLPWCIALGGEPFYNELIRRAEIYEETSLPGPHGRQEESHSGAL